MKEIECPNCGAVFEAKEPKCPYCGHINPMGAEAKFLRDLEKTRKDMDQVDDEARKAYAIIATGEAALYANVILQKGVVK